MKINNKEKWDGLSHHAEATLLSGLSGSLLKPEYTLRKVRGLLDAMEDLLQEKPIIYRWTRIPARFKWAAVDITGTANAYTHKPEIVGDEWIPRDRIKDWHVIGLTMDQYPAEFRDWRNSLQRRPQ